MPCVRNGLGRALAVTRQYDDGARDGTRASGKDAPRKRWYRGKAELSEVRLAGPELQLGERPSYTDMAADIAGFRLATLEKVSEADHIAASGLHDLSSGDAFRRDNGPLQPARGMKTIKTFSGCMLSLATQSGC
jgi:hypothetical protein